MAMILMADIHLEPGESAWERCGRFTSGVCLAGDTINILPFDVERWQQAFGMATLYSLGDIAPHVILVAGNHDPYNLLMKLKFPENVTIVKKIETDGLLITHGHEFTYWKLLAKFAPQFCDWASDKKWWYRFCQSRGWVASQHNMKAGFSKDIAMMWANCLSWCEDHKKSLIVGHSHASMECEDERDGWYFRNIYNDPVEV